MRTIRGRVIALILLLVGGTIVSVAVFSTHLSVNVIRRARHDDELAELQPLRAALLDGDPAAGWEGIRRRLSLVAQTSGRQLLLTDSAGRLAASAPIELHPDDVTIDQSGQLVRWQVDVPIRSPPGYRVIARQRALLSNGGVDGIAINDSGGYRLGTLYYLPIQRPADAAITPTTTYRPLALAAAIVAVAAILLTLLLSRRILGPVEDLTRAAGRMAAGDLGQRVVINGRDEIAALATAFNSMADALVHTQGLRRAMTSDIAHELRTPLTNIRCTVESLADGVVPASPAVIASLQEEVQLLQRLIDDVQDLARADVGELRLRLERLDPGAEAQAAARSVERDAAAAGVRLVTGSAGAPTSLVADRERVQQMLRNLLRNALTHTPANGTITVSVTAPTVAEIAFSVADTGTGIAEEHLPDVFHRFFRVDPSRSRDTGGAGLGLAIVKGLAEAHGGRITVTSGVGRGSTFTITLPSTPSPVRPS